MNWYAARILYESIIKEPAENPAYELEVLFEERTFIISVEDDDDIVEKANALAKQNEDGYDNVEGEQVDWVFKELLEILDISTKKVEDGTEVFYRFWHSPTTTDFEYMRRTHTEAWWKNEPSS